MNDIDKKLWDFHQDENRDHLKSAYPRQDMIAKKVIKHLPLGSKILEIGFGDGYLLNSLSTQGYTMIGQDLSEKNIAITKKQWNNSVEYILGDASGRFDFKDNSLDGFIASEVLEHMDDQQLLICIGEIHRILKKGGYAFITFPAKEHLSSSECLCPNCGNVFHKWGHKQSWNEHKIHDLFHHFTIVSLQEFFNRYAGKNLLEKCIGYCMLFIRTMLNKFTSLDGKNYILIIKK